MLIYIIIIWLKVRGFKKVDIKAGESTDVSFELNYDDLTFINQDLNRVAEDGTFTVYIANLSANFVLNKCF